MEKALRGLPKLEEGACDVAGEEVTVMTAAVLICDFRPCVKVDVCRDERTELLL